MIYKQTMYIPFSSSRILECIVVVLRWTSLSALRPVSEFLRVPRLTEVIWKVRSVYRRPWRRRAVRGQEPNSLVFFSIQMVSTV